MPSATGRQSRSNAIALGRDSGTRASNGWVKILVPGPGHYWLSLTSTDPWAVAPPLYVDARREFLEPDTSCPDVLKPPAQRQPCGPPTYHFLPVLSVVLMDHWVHGLVGGLSPTDDLSQLTIFGRPSVAADRAQAPPTDIVNGRIWRPYDTNDGDPMPVTPDGRYYSETAFGSSHHLPETRADARVEWHGQAFIDERIDARDPFVISDPGMRYDWYLPSFGFQDGGCTDGFLLGTCQFAVSGAGWVSQQPVNIYLVQAGVPLPPQPPDVVVVKTGWAAIQSPDDETQARERAVGDGAGGRHRHDRRHAQRQCAGRRRSDHAAGGHDVQPGRGPACRQRVQGGRVRYPPVAV